MNSGQNKPRGEQDNRPQISGRYAVEYDADGSFHENSRLSDSLVSRLLLGESASHNTILTDPLPQSFILKEQYPPKGSRSKLVDQIEHREGSQIEDSLEHESYSEDCLLSSRLYEGDLNDYLQAPSKDAISKSGTLKSPKVR